MQLPPTEKGRRSENGNGALFSCHWKCIQIGIYSFHVFGIEMHKHDNEGLFVFILNDI